MSIQDEVKRVGQTLQALGRDYKTKNDIVCRPGFCPNCKVYHHSIDEIKAAALEAGIKVHDDGRFEILTFDEWLEKTNRK